MHRIIYTCRFIPGTFKMQSDFIKCVDPENHPRGNHRTCQNVKIIPRIMQLVCK